MRRIIVFVLLIPMLVCVYLKNGETLKINCVWWEIISPTATQTLGGADIEGSSYTAFYKDKDPGYFSVKTGLFAVVPLSEVSYIIEK